MIEKKIVELFENVGLGKVEMPVVQVFGGFLHRMYKVKAGNKYYAVKQLNSEIMKRPDAFSNYEKAEKLESKLEEAGIPIVPALSLSGHKMQFTDGDYFYIFNWYDGEPTDWYNISLKQCFLAGEALGRIHGIEQRTGETEPIEEFHLDLEAYKKKAEDCDGKLYDLLTDSETILVYAENELNSARKRLPQITCISDEDMDPKNVMWNNDELSIIDLECLSYGNPVSHALQLSLQWSGITICELDTGKIKAFFEGYLKAYDNGFREYDKVFGLSYTWLEWLDYNISRALGNCADEEEQRLGIGEVENTLNRIRYIHEKENEIKRVLGTEIYGGKNK